MHPLRLAAIVQAKPETDAPQRLQWAKDFTIGWLAGLIFFGTMLS
ncbi:MAG TPA: hypothetical protein VEY69_05485 [Lautropia sp.]|jgi:hypothetical protein|nr:hypothetical protein [Lautropia sp.]